MRPEVTMPAAPIIDRILEHPEALLLGRRLNGLYGRLAARKQYAEAKQAAENFLAQHSPPDQQNILLGCIVSAYLHRSQCGVIWQYGPPGPDGGPQPGIRGITVQALTSIGMKFRGDSSSLVYSSDVPCCYTALRLTSVWFYYYREYARLKGQPTPEHYADIPESPQHDQPVISLPDGTQQFTQHWAKERIQAKTERGDFTNRQFSVRATDDGKLALFNENGVRFGNISQKKSDPIQPTACLILRLCLYVDEDVSCIAEISG